MDTCIDRRHRKSCVMVTPPTGLVVPVSDTRDYLRAYQEEDALIERLILRATEFCQGWQGRQYLLASFRERYDAFPAGGGDIRLQWGPGFTDNARDVYIEYQYAVGDTRLMTLNAGDYQASMDGITPVIRPLYGQSWPPTLDNPDAVAITYWAGTPLVAGVGQREKQAIDMLTAHWYRNREAVLTGTISNEVEFSVAKLLGPRRIPSVS